MIRTVPLGDLVYAAEVERAGEKSFTVLSMTRAFGLVPQTRVFKKVIASRDLRSYKVVRPNQLVVGIHIDEGALGFSGPSQIGVVSPAYALWDLRTPEEVHIPYLDRFIRSERAMSYFISKYRETAERRGKLTRDQFLALGVPFPPLSEQKRIAAILDAANSLQAKRHESIAQLDLLLESTFLELFGDPVTNPHGWETKTLGQLAYSKPNNGLFRRNNEYLDNPLSGCPVVWVEELFRGNEIDTSKSRRLDPTPKELEKHGLKYGDILFCRSSLKLDGIAYNNVFLGEANQALFECHLIRIQPDMRIVHPRFLNTLLRTAPMRAVFKAKSKTATMTTIDQKALSSVNVIVPPMAAQKRFADVVESVERQKASLRAHLAELDSLFSSLQARAFNGEL